MKKTHCESAKEEEKKTAEKHNKFQKPTKEISPTKIENLIF